MDDPKVGRWQVLVSAYACNPEKGSEPGVGWSWINMISTLADVTVITRESNRAAIERSLQTSPMPTVAWQYIRSVSPIFGRQIDYFAWERRARKVARHLEKQKTFDFAHHLTYGAYWQPNPLRGAHCEKIWGPVGGAERTPPTLLNGLGAKSRWAERTRAFVQAIAERIPAVRQSITMDGLILAKAPETAGHLRALGARNVAIMSEVAFETTELIPPDFFREDAAGRCRFLSMGRILHWKGFQLGLEAFATMARVCPEAEYWIIGTGPLRTALETRASELGVKDRIRFLGQISHSEALQRLRECDVLVHPSMHDSGGWVSLEAMNAGKPVVCLALGGPAVQVTAETGFLIDDYSTNGVVEKLATAMAQLAQDPALRRRMGAAGAERVRAEFSLGVVREKLRLIYASMAHSRIGRA